MTRDSEVEGQPRPRQKVMTSRGFESRDVCSRQEPRSRQEREHRGPWENCAPTAPMVACSRRRIGSIRLEHDGYKNVLDFVITLVVVNSAKYLSIVLSYSD